MFCTQHPERRAAYWAYRRVKDREVPVVQLLCLECSERGIDAGIPESRVFRLGRKNPRPRARPTS